MKPGTVINLYILIVLGGTVVAFSASTWFVCWAGVEIAFLGVLGLVAGPSGTLRREAILKYFIVQTAARACLMIGGVGLYYGYGGLFSLIALVGGVLLKLGAWPVHFWVIGVSHGLEWRRLFVILAPAKAAALVLGLSTLKTASFNSEVFILIGTFTIIWGAILGLAQTNLRAMLGARRIAHTGWLLLSLPYGSTLLYYIIYIAALGAVSWALKDGATSASAVAVFALRGLPPAAAFAGKLSVLGDVLAGEAPTLVIWVAIIGALIRVFFYLKFALGLYLGGAIAKPWRKALAAASLIAGALIFVI